MKNTLFLIFLVAFISCKTDINQENRIKEDVTFLASDALEGRQTGWPRNAAGWLYAGGRRKASIALRTCRKTGLVRSGG